MFNKKKVSAILKIGKFLKKEGDSIEDYLKFLEYESFKKKQEEPIIKFLTYDDEFDEGLIRGSSLEFLDSLLFYISNGNYNSLDQLYQAMNSINLNTIYNRLQQINSSTHTYRDILSLWKTRKTSFKQVSIPWQTHKIYDIIKSNLTNAVINQVIVNEAKILVEEFNKNPYDLEELNYSLKEIYNKIKFEQI